MDKRLAIAIVLIVLIVIALSLPGCSSTPATIIETRTVYVDKPIPTRAQAPAELLAAYTPGSLPQFIAPSAPGAAAALDEAGLQSLREVLRALKTRDDAWRAWAEAPVDGR